MQAATGHTSASVDIGIISNKETNMTFFDWISPTVGIVKDELTPHHSFLCNSEDDAHSLMIIFKKASIYCWLCGQDTVSGQAFVCVRKEDTMKACNIVSVTTPAKASPFDGCGRIVALSIVALFICVMLYLCSMVMVMPGG